jgi:transcriptional regulator with XRE-family HTH domain
MKTIVVLRNLIPKPVPAMTGERCHEHSCVSPVTPIATDADDMLTRSWEMHVAAPQFCSRMHNAFLVSDPLTVVWKNRGKPGLHIRSYVVKSYSVIELDQLSIIQWVIQSETTGMNPDQTVQLINLLSKKREESALSVAEVARRAHLDVGAVWRIEQGMIASPRAESLIAIGGVLGIPSIDLFTIVGWLTPDELPSLRIYLRTKYRDLSDKAVADVERNVTAVVEQDLSSSVKPAGPDDTVDPKEH